MSLQNQINTKSQYLKKMVPDFSGLGVGMLVGYRIGFLARPTGYRDSSYSYNREHQGETYNKREDGLIECAIANTTTYIKVKGFVIFDRIVALMKIL